MSHVETTLAQRATPHALRWVRLKHGLLLCGKACTIAGVGGNLVLGRAGGQQ